VSPLQHRNYCRVILCRRQCSAVRVQVLGWIRSWSGYATWRAAKVPGPDPLLQFHGDLKDALEFDSHSDTVEIAYEFYLMLARRTRGGTGQA